MENLLLQVKDLRVWFPVRRSLVQELSSKQRLYARAVDGISLEIREREILCLVGESGSGKTTTGRAVLRLVDATSGSVVFRDQDLFKLKRDEMKRLRQRMQMIFQDPFESLNPRMKVADIVAEPLDVNRLVGERKEREKRVKEALESVELSPEDCMYRYPHELSGGQRQRVSIASALVLEPEFIVADEPVSMLDVSIRAGILNLMLRLRDIYGMAYMFITHDLSIAFHIADRIAVMYLGKIVEIGEAEAVITRPGHPYTEALLRVAPVSHPRLRHEKKFLQGEIPSSTGIPQGCRFHPRCPLAEDYCRRVEPELRDVERNHLVACHRLAR
jgi:oligopeptide/dipeptide ABC transporter ATP-binding protein